MRDLGDGTYECPDCENIVGVEDLVPKVAARSGFDTYCRGCRAKRKKAYAKTETGRLAAGRCVQRQYVNGAAGLFFSKRFD